MNSTVYEALSLSDHMGISAIGGHPHCQFPASQQPDVNAFIQKFLFDQMTNTTIIRTDATYPTVPDKWRDWTTPILKL